MDKYTKLDDSIFGTTTCPMCVARSTIHVRRLLVAVGVPTGKDRQYIIQNGSRYIQNGSGLLIHA